MKLVACPNCRAQYDVSQVAAATIPCPCGTQVSARPPEARDASVRRCAACGALVGDSERTCSYCDAQVARAAAPAGPVCPQCFARNPEQARHCTACGVAFLPQPVRTRAQALDCPVCRETRLAARIIDGLWVSECPSCLGLWAPGDIMDQIVDRILDRRNRGGMRVANTAQPVRRAAWKAEVSCRTCPECRVGMQRKNFGRRSGVIVDWCQTHGTWLDADEMEDIAEYVMAEGLHREVASGGKSGLPADPGRAAAMLAAERILAEERARSGRSGQGAHAGRTWKGLGDLFTELLK